MPTTTPAVSVVMSVYNGRDFLPAALDSLLSQDHRDFEIVAINDGSTDGSQDILQEYADHDERIRLLSQENKGLIASLNRGLAESRAPLIARMDADDVSRPQRLRRQVAYLDAHPEVGVLGGVAAYVDSKGRPLGSNWPRWTTPAVTAWQLQFGTVVCHPTVVMRRSVIDAVGSYDSAALYAEDYDLWVRCLDHTVVANLPDVILDRRKWDGTVGATHGGAQEQTVLEIMGRHHRTLTGTAVDAQVTAAVRDTQTARAGLAPLAVDGAVSGAAAERIEDLLSAFESSHSLNNTDRRVVRRDAARRLLSLVPHATLPRRAVIAGRAARLSPSVVIPRRVVAAFR